MAKTFLGAHSHGAAAMAVERPGRRRGEGLLVDGDSLGGAIRGKTGGGGDGALRDRTSLGHGDAGVLGKGWMFWGGEGELTLR